MNNNQFVHRIIRGSIQCAIVECILIWSFLFPANSIAQGPGPVLEVADILVVSEECMVVVGSITQDITDTGALYYEFVDNVGVLDAGYLMVSQDGSYFAYLTPDLLAKIAGDPLLLLYDPLDDDSAPPIQISYILGLDSVSGTFTRLMASGSVAEIRSFITLMEGTGQITTAQLGQLVARLVAIEAAQVAIGRIVIQFGANLNQAYHTFRHVVSAGLNPGIVQTAVQADLTANAAAIIAGLNVRTILVSGKKITYSVFKFPNGVLNVGRITVP